MIKGFQNASVVFPTGVKKSNLVFQNGKIQGYGEEEGLISLPEGIYVAPGFIDEHIHGANGADVMDGKESSLDTMSKALVQEGVTSFLATTMTESMENIEKALVNVREYQKKEAPGARIIGVHLEGPFISPTFKGAQALEFIRKPNVEELDRLVKLSGNSIREVTFAYERDENGAFLEYCKNHDIVASLGHSDCPGPLAIQGFRSGVHCITHLYNAQRRFHHRDVGVTGAALLTDGVKTELIADFHHSCKEAVEFVFKNKKREDIVLISDSTEAKYLPEGAEAHLGSQKIFVSNGVALLEDGTIAGSILHLDQALRNVALLAQGYTFADLINLVSLNPAKNLGLEKEIGSLEIGKRADCVLLDSSFEVLMSIRDGKIVFQKEGFAL